MQRMTLLSLCATFDPLYSHHRSEAGGIVTRRVVALGLARDPMDPDAATCAVHLVESMTTCGLEIAEDGSAGEFLGATFGADVDATVRRALEVANAAESEQRQQANAQRARAPVAANTNAEATPAHDSEGAPACR